MLRADAATRVFKGLWTSTARSREELRIVPSTLELFSPRTLPARLRDLLARPVDALPVDLFRVLIGGLTFAYFARTLIEAPDFSAPGGLIDHDLSHALFWFTQTPVFREGMSLLAFQVIFAIACLASLAVIAGYRVKLFAALLYLIAVSAYRWNFLVMYVDDVVMHLMLFWLLLLPVGRTLVLREWLVQRERSWSRWKTTMVPGAAVRGFLLNVTLIYLVAGLWKWTSPMWRNGTALYAILKLPIAFVPDFWGPQHMPLLKALNYIALILETIFPVIFLFPRGHRAKYAMLLALLGFHVGMLVTLQIPFANFACMAATVILFGPELMAWLRRGTRSFPAVRETARIGVSGAIALVFVFMLAMAMLSSVTLPQWRMPGRSADVGTRPNGITVDGADGLRPLQKTFFGPLWMVGIAQQYQLFNWIDERNYSVHYDVVGVDARGAHTIDPEMVFLRSTRGALLQTYVHGVTWMQVLPDRQAQLRESIYVRSARRYCRQVDRPVTVSVYSTLRRLEPAGSDRIEQSRTLLMQFRCGDGEPQMQSMNLNSLRMTVDNHPAAEDT